MIKSGESLYSSRLFMHALGIFMAIHYLSDSTDDYTYTMYRGKRIAIVHRGKEGGTSPMAYNYEVMNLDQKPPTLDYHLPVVI